MIWQLLGQPGCKIPVKSHGQRSLVGYSPWSHKESDTTERLHIVTPWPAWLSRVRVDRRLGSVCRLA